MTWQLTCPGGGNYTCKGHYTGGHGEPFILYCDDIKTIKGPRGGACLDAELAEPKHRCSGARCAHSSFNLHLRKPVIYADRLNKINKDYPSDMGKNIAISELNPETGNLDIHLNEKLKDEPKMENIIVKHEIREASCNLNSFWRCHTYAMSREPKGFRKKLENEK